ncbi:MAG: MotA/TolQ/ExbB proton channel family protein [Verrucomicrobiota bacterium]|nr:MotA/TolQ/ExbB proton channel family protein [Verrucomicrobiota bacterium]
MSLFIRIFLASIALLGAAGAQSPASGNQSTELTLLEIVEETGFLIWPLTALSVIAVFLIIFYMLTIRRGAVVSDRFMNSADTLIRKQDYLGLLEVCNRQEECISRITAKTLTFATKNPTASFDEVREVTEAEGSRQASILHQRIQYLADIGAIAPMVGLLGTVIGMIKAFREIAQHSFVGSKQTGLASGVSEALLTTAGGLCIGIPALIFYSMFRGRVQRLVSELEAAATHIMALLAAQYKQATSRTSTGTRTRTSRYTQEEKNGNTRKT